MYRSLKIKHYRRFSSLELENLGRINLLVGTNNSGKTSILECVELLQSTNNPNVLSEILRRRGEWDIDPEEDRNSRINLEHLFNDHNFDMDIAISAEEEHMNANSRNEVKISVDDKLELISSVSDKELQDLDDDLVLSIIWSNSDDSFRFGISHEGYTRGRFPVARRLQQESHRPVQFIQTNGMSSHEVKTLFDNVVLTDSEGYVIDALRIIDPSIERIASVGSDARPFQKFMSWDERPRGIFVKSTDTDQRISIGSVGDGMWRMLGLALAMAGAKGGVVLIDEIDAGLHYSVMQKMWKMISERALALGIQVFATTHSRDCYESLASIVEPDLSQSEVVIHRIEPDRGCSVTFSNQEVVVAANRGLEVR